MSVKTAGLEKATVSNHLGLEHEAMYHLSVSLNNLLSDYHIFYQNVRGFHWNVSGSDFFDLHVRFEELYKELSNDIDELAERIVTIGYKPLHAYSDFLTNTTHMEVKNVKDGKQCVNHVINGLGMLIASQRKVAVEASHAEDIATTDLLTKFIVDLEKRLWMFTMSSK
ncbi:MAG: DNA starvation/stationary phase protection protein [Chitinophagaceae bacterium]|nr:DNA starvation/stationary phase protection protein [Chitinophagaceae bacterium]